VSAQRKRFRIEISPGGSAEHARPFTGATDQTDETSGDAASNGITAAQHREIMDAIAALNEKIEANSGTREGAIAPALLDQYKAELREAANLASKLEGLQSAIDKTKKEIVMLYDDGASGERLNQLVGELEHVVGGTETATDTILSQTEKIEGAITGFTALLPQGVDDSALMEIQDSLTSIMEACNFQDLTGQRITKVVKAMAFIEDRVTAMREIWGEHAFEGMEVEKQEHEEDDPQSFLHGPGMEGDTDRSNQDDIDALFD